jgi:undecaprenyl-diphosphatase
VAGLALEPLIERRLSGPRVAACAQIACGLLLAASSTAAGRSRLERRGARADLLRIGIAQGAALIPGVSRNGATLTAARALGYDRDRADRLSWRAGLPIIGGAALLKGVRLAQHGLDRDLRAPFAAGAAAAFASTLAAGSLRRAARRSYLPIAVYRVALGAIALRRLHRLEWPRG